MVERHGCTVYHSGDREVRRDLSFLCCGEGQRFDEKMPRRISSAGGCKLRCGGDGRGRERLSGDDDSQQTRKMRTRRRWWRTRTRTRVIGARKHRRRSEIRRRSEMAFIEDWVGTRLAGSSVRRRRTRAGSEDSAGVGGVCRRDNGTPHCQSVGRAERRSDSRYRRIVSCRICRFDAGVGGGRWELN